ncbi:MAG: hypothetical protein KJ601_03475 [Nanoarchaeota archaeon]|nr:hypothetical protein [Nanoarchaeota archaeon]MBU1704567.1 hypothetical protein [Nanoarchaeota archaeon]
MSKIIKKVSKKTLGKSVDTVADYIDLFSQIVAEYIDRRYKIQKKVEDIKQGTINTLYRLKSEFIKSVVQALFLSIGLFSLVFGLILWANRFASLDHILIVVGLIVTIGVLIKMKLKP